MSGNPGRPASSPAVTCGSSRRSLENPDSRNPSPLSVSDHSVLTSQSTRPGWPDAEPPQQMHLDIAVDDLYQAEEQALAPGAVRLPGSGATFRVYQDPSGHPFCLCLQIWLHTWPEPLARDMPGKLQRVHTRATSYGNTVRR